MNIWEKLSARNKRLSSIVVLLGGIALFSLMLGFGSKDEKKSTRRQAINEAILTDSDTRETSIDRLAGQLEEARSDNAKLAVQIKELITKQDEMPEAVARKLQKGTERAANSERRKLEARLKQLETEITRLDETARAAKKKAAKAKTPVHREEPEETVDLTPAPTAEPVVKLASSGIVFPDAAAAGDDPASVFRQSEPLANTAGQPVAKPGAVPEGGSAKQDQVLSLRFVSKKDTDDAIAGNKALPEVGANLFKLPATSILTGTLITGLDAPTGAQAQQAPLPVLLRLKKEAILPNRFKADVRECFVLLGAFGELSSERAQMRGEVMSCVLNDGTILEQPLKGFAVGEDGKAGPRGRLVRREGTFIARAITVGLLEAAGNALNSNQLVQVGSGGGGFDAQAAAQSITGSAAGNALGRVADWYIDQAFQLFPVIEIDAGREIDVVLTGTFEMNLPLEDD